MNFQPLAPTEHARLRKALHDNADGLACLTMTEDTTFDLAIPNMVDGEMTEDQVINAIKSVPMHYAPGGYPAVDLYDLIRDLAHEGIIARFVMGSSRFVGIPILSYLCQIGTSCSEI